MKFQRTLSTLVIIKILIFAVITMDAQIAGSLEFNGMDNYVEINNSPLNTIGTGDFTIEAWVKGEESEQNNHPMILSNRGTSASGGGILFFFHDVWGGSQSKMLCFQISGVNYLLLDNGTLNGSILDNKCHHVAITRNDNQISYYADGLLLGTKNIGSNSTVSFDGPLWIGKDRPTNNTFNGLISQCRIWFIARTQEEIFENKDVRLQGTEAGLLAYWELNEGIDQLVLDKTDNQFDGYLGDGFDVNVQDPVWSEDGCVEGFTTSTNDLEASSIKVYPNPTTDFVMIEKQSIESFQLDLFNQMGQLLLTQNINSESQRLDLSKFPKGIYYINVIHGEKTLAKKIVKQ